MDRTFYHIDFTRMNSYCTIVALPPRMRYQLETDKVMIMPPDLIGLTIHHED